MMKTRKNLKSRKSHKNGKKKGSRKTAKRSKHSKGSKRVYSSNDYNSGDGMLTAIWGPGIWHFLHTMSFNYPVKPTREQKKQYMDFVLQLQHVLPCSHCRLNMKKNLEMCPLTMATMKDRESFSRFIYRLHETVNKMLHKESGLTYEEVRERYEHFRARCTIDKSKEKGAAVCKPLNPVVVGKCSVGKAKSGKKKGSKKESGCTEPLYGKKAKAVIKIVPHDTKCPTLEIDERCVKRRS